MKDETKRKRAYAPRTKRARAKGPLYPEGVPLDENGVPEENVALTQDRIRQIGALDADSAKLTQEHRNIMAAKQRGEPVHWNSEEAIALEEIREVHPTATLYFRRIEPDRDDNIPARPISFIQNYEGLRRYLTEAHWDGKVDATYIWTARAKGLPQISTGSIRFARTSEDVMTRQNGNGGHPPAGFIPPHVYAQPPYNPYVPAYAPPYGYAPQPQYQQPPQPQYQAPAPAQSQPQPQQHHEPQGAAPAPGQPQMFPMIGPDGTQAGWLINGIFYAAGPGQQQQVQPPPPVQPPPQVPVPVAAPAPAPSTDFQSFLVTKLLETVQQNTQFMEQMRHAYDRQQPQQQMHQQPYFPMYPGLTPVSYGIPPGYTVAQPQPQQPAPPATPPVVPEPVLTPAQIMAKTMAEATSAVRAQKEFADTVRQLAGVSDEPPPEPPAPIVAPDDFPLKLKEIGGVTMGAIDDEVLGFGETALLNAPKIISYGLGFVDKIFDRIDKARTEKKGEDSEALVRREKEVELEERAVQARKTQQDAKADFEKKRLEIRAAHQYLDTQGQPAPEPPVPPPPPAPVPPPPPPAPVVESPPAPEPAPEPEPEVAEAPVIDA